MNNIADNGFHPIEDFGTEKKVVGIKGWYWRIRRSWRRSKKDRSFRNLSKALPDWCTEVEQARAKKIGLDTPFKRVALFGVLQYWIEQTALLGCTLSGYGKEICIATLPYSTPNKPMPERDIHQQEQKIQTIFRKLAPFIQHTSLYRLVNDHSDEQLPKELEERVREISLRDVQYLLQIEEFDVTDPNSPVGRLYLLRLERNRRAMASALQWLQQLRPDGILIPNGSILETAVVYQVACFLGIPRVTYEFGEQQQRIWLAQDAEVMLQETDALWEARKEIPLTDQQWEKIRELFSARQKADLWQNFSRRWQGVPSQGSQIARQILGLDERPIALLAANVIGDSLTLDRQVFTHSMTEWLIETVKFFMNQTTAQLVVRVHPGERYTKGPSVALQIKQKLGELPTQIHLVGAEDPINTYDLMGLADLGLVYTTTAGLEMAMAGVPVVVTGKTHYRQRGFTLDPQSWDEYYLILKEHLLEQHNFNALSEEQVNIAWNYAYRFFFEYPFEFPWRLHFFKQGDVQDWSLGRVFSEEGLKKFYPALSVLSGASLDWSKLLDQPESVKVAGGIA